MAARFLVASEERKSLVSFLGSRCIVLANISAVRLMEAAHYATKQFSRLSLGDHLFDAGDDANNIP